MQNGSIGTELNDAFATRMNLVGVTPTEETSFEMPPPRQPPTLPPMTESKTHHATYTDAVPRTPEDMREQPANPYFTAYIPEPAPTTPFPSQTAPSPAPVPPTPAPQQPPDLGYLGSLWARRRDAQKLIVLGLVVTLGIAIHWTASHFIVSWTQEATLTPKQSTLLRLAYPAAAFLAAWNAKTFSIV